MRDQVFVALQYLLPRHWLTAVVWRIARIRHPAVKNFLIRQFASAFDVDLDPVEDPAPPMPEDASEVQSDQAGDDDGEAEPQVERADPEDVARRDAELAGWVYRVPTYKYEQIVRRMEDLLRPVEE